MHYKTIFPYWQRLKYGVHSSYPPNCSLIYKMHTMWCNAVSADGPDTHGYQKKKKKKGNMSADFQLRAT